VIAIEFRQGFYPDNGLSAHFCASVGKSWMRVEWGRDMEEKRKDRPDGDHWNTEKEER
jgi:hypothetical protein